MEKEKTLFKVHNQSKIIMSDYSNTNYILELDLDLDEPILTISTDLETKGYENINQKILLSDITGINYTFSNSNSFLVIEQNMSLISLQNSCDYNVDEKGLQLFEFFNLLELHIGG